MEMFLDPSIWAGLLMLVALEIVLGIDNLVFIAILSEKLPKKQRDKARLYGLSLALLMRLSLLSLISWMVTITNPLINIFNFHFSSRDLILLLGGIFLLFKATRELHERLENKKNKKNRNQNNANFIEVVIQIVILDAIFSLDSVITAVGMVNNLTIMMIAVILAMGLMLLASKILTTFINMHPTVVVLCLSFLLMIGFSLLAEGFGFHIPKGYLYVAIGFSILIELLNQIGRRNFVLSQSKRSMRDRTAEAILKLVGSSHHENVQNRQFEHEEAFMTHKETFKDEERYMINGVLTLAARSIKSIMTPRNEISWVNIQRPLHEIRMQLLDTPHSLFPICKGVLDKIVGVVRAKDLLVALDHGINIENFSSIMTPIIVSDKLDPINLLSTLRHARGSFVIVSNASGIVQGLITPLDVLEAIAGEFPDADEGPNIILKKNI